MPDARSPDEDSPTRAGGPAGRVIHIHPDAPGKPVVGQDCNGCGVCCLAEPCPIGMLVSRRRRGVCDALQWHDASSTYQCGCVTTPEAWLPISLRWLAPAARRLALRLIASGQGCDCDYEVQR